MAFLCMCFYILKNSSQYWTSNKLATKIDQKLASKTSRLSSWYRGRSISGAMMRNAKSYYNSWSKTFRLGKPPLKSVSSTRTPRRSIERTGSRAARDYTAIKRSLTSSSAIKNPTVIPREARWRGIAKTFSSTRSIARACRLMNRIKTR